MLRRKRTLQWKEASGSDRNHRDAADDNDDSRSGH
jgi:hypothetical protein